MNTVFIFCLISFALSLDSVGLISIEAYWITTGGDIGLSGLLFGIYDGFTIILKPILAWLIYNKNYKYKTILISSLLINIAGNIVYSTAFVANTWIMVLVGRGVSGMGSSCLPLLMVYVCEKMPLEQQVSAVGYIKYVSALSRVVGPLLGSLFSATLRDNLILNPYTVAGWIPIVFGVITTALVCMWTEDTTPIIIDTKVDKMNIVRIFWPILLLGFVSTFIYWFFVGNVFTLATHYYYIVSNEHELGKLYYSGIGGFCCAFVLFMIFREPLSNIRCLSVSFILLIATSALYVFEQNYMFYVNVGLTTFAYALGIPGINIINNILAKRSSHILGKWIWLSITLLSAFQSLARFAGPVFFGLTVITIEIQDCNLQGENYITNGCSLYGFLQTSVIYLSVSALLLIVGTFFLAKEMRPNQKSILPVQKEYIPI